MRLLDLLTMDALERASLMACAVAILWLGVALALT